MTEWEQPLFMCGIYQANTLSVSETRALKIELIEPILSAFRTLIEMKWNPTKKVLFSKSFTEAYNVKETIVISPDNYLEYL